MVSVQSSNEPAPNTSNVLAPESDLTKLAEAYGIVQQFTHTGGHIVKTTDEQNERLLRALCPGFQPERSAELLAELNRQRLERHVPPFNVFRQDASGAAITPQVSLSLPAHITMAAWKLEGVWTMQGKGQQCGFAEVSGCLQVSDLDNSSSSGTSQAGGVEYSHYSFKLPCSLQPGLYKLSLQFHGMNGSSTSRETTLLVSQQQCYRDPELTGSWGLTAHVPSLWSRERPGPIGSFRDLIECARLVARFGAKFAGPVDPMTLPEPTPTSGASPFSATSKVLANPYLAYLPEWMRELNLTECLEAYQSDENLAQLRAVCAEPGGSMPLYQAQWFLFRWYERMFAEFQRKHQLTYEDLFESEGRRTQGAAAELCRFIAERRNIIVPFVDYAIAREHLFPKEKWDKTPEEEIMWNFQNWPDELRSPDGAGVPAFRREHADRAMFYAFFIWVAERAEAQLIAELKDLGIKRLIRALAVGAPEGGFDHYFYQAAAIPGVGQGAPGDSFEPKGQWWGGNFILNLMKLCEAGYAPLIEQLSYVMAKGGALFLDHPMVLARIWGVAQEDHLTPTMGAYLSSNFEEVAGILIFLSNYYQVPVMGEAAGTLPEGFQEALEGCGIDGFEVQCYARDWDNDRAPLPPNKWRSGALAVTGYTNVAPLGGQLIGIEGVLGLATESRNPAQAQASFAGVTSDRKLWLAALLREGLIDPNEQAELEAALAGQAPPAPLDQLSSDQVNALRANLEQYEVPELFTFATAAYALKSIADKVAVDWHSVIGATWPHNLPGVHPDRYPSFGRREVLPVEDMNDTWALEAVAYAASLLRPPQECQYADLQAPAGSLYWSELI